VNGGRFQGGPIIQTGPSRPEQANSLIERIKNRTLDEKDYETLVSIVNTILYLYKAVAEKHHSILRLVRMIFGAKTESARNVLKESSVAPQGKAPGRDNVLFGKRDFASKEGPWPKWCDSYPGAPRVPLAMNVSGQAILPALPGGKLYPMSPPATILRMSGHAPVEPTIFELERLRCNLCGEVFTAGLLKEPGRGNTTNRLVPSSPV